MLAVLSRTHLWNAVPMISKSPGAAFDLRWRWVCA